MATDMMMSTSAVSGRSLGPSSSGEDSPAARHPAHQGSRMTPASSLGQGSSCSQASEASTASTSSGGRNSSNEDRDSHDTSSSATSVPYARTERRSSSHGQREDLLLDLRLQSGSPAHRDLGSPHHLHRNDRRRSTTTAALRPWAAPGTPGAQPHGWGADAKLEHGCLPGDERHREGADVFEPERILSVSFNQDNSCFACGTTSGFRVFSCQGVPLRESLCRATHPLEISAGLPQQQPGVSFSGGIQKAEMLYRSNMMALVGGGKKPRFPANKVVIWDDDRNEGRRCVGELVFRSEVKGVRLRRDRVVVLLEHKVYVYSLVDLRLLAHLDTMPGNTHGSRACHVGGELLAVSQAPHNFVLACLGLQRGQVHVEHFDAHRTKLISAHESCIAALALTPDGTRLATASARGTLARIFCTTDGTMLQELRRGADRADIYSLAFHPMGTFLALTSDKGTVHVFSVNPCTDKDPGTSPPRSWSASSHPTAAAHSTGGTPAHGPSCSRPASPGGPGQGLLGGGGLGGGGPATATATAMATGAGAGSGQLCAVQASRAAGSAALRAQELSVQPPGPSQAHDSPGQLANEGGSRSVGSSLSSDHAALGTPAPGTGNTATGTAPAAGAGACNVRPASPIVSTGSEWGVGGGLVGGWGTGSHGLWSQRQQQLSPVHPIENKLRQHRQQQQQQHHSQRLRQSQSCPPRRWVADGIPRGDHDSATASAPALRHSSEYLTAGEDSSQSEDAGHGQKGRRPQSRPSVANPGSSLAFLRVVLPRYFSSEWSVAQFRHLPSTAPSTVAFGSQKHTLLVVTLCGRFFRLRFDPVHGGEMAVEESSDILSLAAVQTLRASALPGRCQGEAMRGAVGQVHAS